ncbi:hypothetical protein AB0J52_22675 [Spirillospora sp. NPDC049652]
MDLTEDEAFARLRTAAGPADADLAADPVLDGLLDELGAGLTSARRPFGPLRIGPRTFRPRTFRPRRVSRTGGVRRPSGIGRHVMVFAAAAATALVLLGCYAVLRDDGVRRPPDRPATGATTPPAPPPLKTGLYGAAVAGSMRAGEFADASEWINLGSPELPGFLDSQQRGLTLPPGESWGPLRVRLIRPGKRLQITALIFNVRRYALCRNAAAYVATEPGSARTRYRLFIEKNTPWTVVGASGPAGRKSRPGDPGHFTRTFHFIQGPVTDTSIRAFASGCNLPWTLSGALR